MPTEFSYLLHSVPGNVAGGYLTSIQGLQKPPQLETEVTLFSYYSDRDPQESILELAKQFPDNCYLFRNQVKNTCLIVVASYDELPEILAFLSRLSCRHFYHILLNELERKTAPVFQVGDQTWKSDTPRVMAILNITPDSFYDGGKHLAAHNFGDIAEQFIAEGADIIDIGGESSRPGSQPVTADEEIKRILPAVNQIRQRFRIPISVDTVKPEVAEEALKSGADMINDISGLAAGERMTAIVARYKAAYCLMHILGTPDRMQQNPEYSDVIAEVYAFLKEKQCFCLNAGIAKEKLCIDPGIGFGKKFHHNLHLLRLLPAFLNLDQLILMGTSNKSFVGQALERETDERLPGSLATQVMGWSRGATIFRVHEVKATRDAVNMAKYYSR